MIRISSGHYRHHRRQHCEEEDFGGCEDSGDGEQYDGGEDYGAGVAQSCTRFPCYLGMEI